MADSLFDACSAAGKCLCTSFNTLDPKSPGIVADGVAQHWSVNYDVQVRLMGTVLETGSATVGDLIAALPGHPAPVAAIMALVENGHLLRQPGVVTPFTVINSPSMPVKNKGGDGSGDGTPKPSDPKTGKIFAFPATVAHLDSTRFVPSVSVVAAKDRRDLPRFAGPAIYLGVKGLELYPGCTSKGWDRIAAAHLKDYEGVAVIRDLSGQLDDRQAAAAERILGLHCQALPKYSLANQLPNGAVVSDEEYAALRLFVGEALLIAQRLGLGLIAATPKRLLAGAAGALRHMLPGGMKAVPEGTEYHLYACGVEARAIESDGDWIVLPGSEVRKKVTASAGASGVMLRSEWLFSGVLRDEGSRYRLMQPVVFDSGTGAANFVLGSKGPNLSGWSRPGPTPFSRAPLTT